MDVDLITFHDGSDAFTVSTTFANNFYVVAARGV